MRSRGDALPVAVVQRFKVILTSLALTMLPITVDARVSGEKPSLTVDEARLYLLKLINNDRKANGQRSVELDPIATTAGQQHSDDMAENGYLSHWDLSGKKPDQRYTLAGGRATVAENAYILSYTDSPQRQTLSQPQLFSPEELDRAEHAFMNEVPPNDGHRKNILDSNHTAVGIGISISGDENNRRMALAQEFVDNYGTFSLLPQKIKAGESFSVAGKLDPGINLYSIDLRWEPPPRPMTVKQLKDTYSYGAPEERVMTFWPARGRRGGIAVTQTQDGVEFTNQVFADPGFWKPGLYYVFVWATRDGDQRPFVVSRRTIEMGH